MLNSMKHHVNFNLKALTIPYNTQQLNGINHSINTFFQDYTEVTYAPTQDPYHVTLGQSAYFKEDHSLQKVNGEDTIVDFNNVYTHFTQNLCGAEISSMGSYLISGFRITDPNGFVIMQLIPNQNIKSIAKCYQDACNKIQKNTPNLQLTRHYRSSENLDFHITLGKLNGISNKAALLEMLSSLFNDEEIDSSEPISLSNELILEAAYKTHQQRVCLAREILNLNNTPSVLSAFSNSTQKYFTVREIKQAIDQFFPLDARITNSVGVKLDSKTQSKYYEITFINKMDKINFCKKFAKIPGQRGECRYSPNNECHVYMDNTAIQVLIENSQPNFLSLTNPSFSS